MPVEARFDLPPEEAMKFFRKKGLSKSFDYRDLWRDEHEVAFTVAKMADVDLLADVKDAVDRAIAEGLTLEQFKKDLTPRLQKAGWWGVREQVDPITGEKQLVQLGSARRLQTIFRTNMMTAYSAGEWAQIEETAESAPFLMYDAVGDNRTRPQHRAWDGIVLRWDDPWWQSHRPPNGYNCRCSAIQVSERDVKRLGKTVGKAPKIEQREFINKRTGETMQVPRGIDPGFDYNPGAMSTRKRNATAALVAKREAFIDEMAP